MQSVKVYVEDPLQQDWDEIAERLVFAINNSHDMTRKETPLYLVHGWGVHSTLRAMTTSRGEVVHTEALAWRREINRQQQIALEMANNYQAAEKVRHARIHNEKLSRKEQAAIPKSETTTRPTTNRSLYFDLEAEFGLKPGLVKKLAHRWRGPFRVKRKVEEFAYELELPDKSGYRFYPVVHVSRLKADARLNFDEELLPEDSWEAAAVDGEFEVEAILDDRTPISASTARLLREFE
ncbi:LOW QUALITY PROTEIN: hypothetical protein PHMEG_00022891, partial [Phytophthora megakarya]